MRRVLPVAIAALVLAGIALGLYFANRQGPIPTSSSASPAVGSCWNVTSVSAPMPWPGQPVDCATPHTAEIFYAAQVDRSLIKDYRAAKPGQDQEAASILMQGEARSGCSGRASAYLGSAWRADQVTIAPDFVGDVKDGFYACAVAQVSDPAGKLLVSRTTTLKGAQGLGIDCTVGEDSFVPCSVGHTSEYVGLYTVTPLGAPFNGPELQTAVTAGCQSLLNGFLGLPGGATNRSDLQSSYVGPTTSATWIGSDQSYACYATAANTITGSVKALGTRPLTR